MAIRKPAPPRPAPPRPAPRQTFGDQMAAKMAMQKQVPTPQVSLPPRPMQPMPPRPMQPIQPIPPRPMPQGGAQLPQNLRGGVGAQMSRPAPQAMVDAVGAGNAGRPLPPAAPGLNMSGMGMKKGGSVGSASKRADGIAQRGKTKGRVI